MEKTSHSTVFFEETEATKGKAHVLAILDHTGHTAYAWDSPETLTGDALEQAKAIVEQAKIAFEEAKSQGYTPIKIEDDGSATKLNHFDETAPRTTMIPRMQGG